MPRPKQLSRLVRLALFWLALFILAPAVRAHNPGLSTLEIRATPAGLDAILTFARADLEPLATIDSNHDGTITPDEFVAALPKLETLAARSLALTVDGRARLSAPPEVEMDENNNVLLKLQFPGPPAKKWAARSLLLRELPAAHRQYATVETAPGGPPREFMLSARGDSIEVDDTVAPMGRPQTSPAGNFFTLGLEHILTGYDHLLFLFALLIVCERFWEVARIVTCFTAAHSITLALAAFQIVNLPSRITEPAIAASIVYVGCENLFRRRNPRSRELVAFLFGLVHGFGFAGALREIGLARSGWALAGPLVSFNLGVEAGQIAVAAVLLPVIWRLRRHPGFAPRCVPACSAAVIALGAYWFVERVFFG